MWQAVGTEKVLKNNQKWKKKNDINDGDDGDDHVKLNWKAGRFVKKGRSCKGGGKKKAAVPTYKIYKKEEFG